MTRSSSPSQFHEALYSSITPSLGFQGQTTVQWRRELASAFQKALGWDPSKERGRLNVEILEEAETKTYTRRKLVFESEPGADVWGHLLTPKGPTGNLPAFVCLQGHTNGMHVSIGEVRNDRDQNCVDRELDYAIQAVHEGYIALAIEQRAFGERKEALQQARATSGCEDAAMHALLFGHTLLAERAWDVSRAIDLLETIPGVDKSRIGCMGASGGGTATYYAACVDERISIAMPACSVCTYADSIFRINHCTCNYIPGILKIADMGDLAGLIAPRKLIIVAGDKDEIFPIEGVRRAYDTAERIYAAVGASNRIRLVVCDGGHRFFARESWAAVREML
ncbi:MAG: alpha/beta hydrolase family protein [Capsulimonadaceae bacterium]|nr:alpha/beta hydrolase family protein [Capsulimonadaceae bacterium]